MDACSSLRSVPFLKLVISVFPVDPVDVISSRLKLLKSSSTMLSIMVPLLSLLLEIDAVDATERFLPSMLFFAPFSKTFSPDDVVELPLSLMRCSLVLNKKI